jgi:hypothetical protein
MEQGIGCMTWSNNENLRIEYRLGREKLSGNSHHAARTSLKGSLDHFANGHRRWLRGLGLLDRPWFVLGGAPEPTLPTELVATHARVDINNSGRTAVALGMGRADLSIRRAKASWSAHPELDTRGLIWFTEKNILLLRLELWHRRHASVDSLVRVKRTLRDALVAHVVGPEIKDVGKLGKPSNGIVAVCFGLYFGVPEIVLTGVSLTQQGHSYDQLNRPRKQVDEDLHVLQILSRDARVATTERELAVTTGLRLWSGA